MRPILIITVGIPGSGKSTYASTLNDFTVVSSDAIRTEINGNENDQSNPEKVFDVMFARTVDALASGQNVIYDSTNINGMRRKELLSKIRLSVDDDIIFKTVFFNTPYQECIHRNRSRSRHVPEKIIASMSKRLQKPDYSEGWDEIEIIG